MSGLEYDADNIFAKIIRGEIPCFKIFETEHAQRRCLAALSRGTLASAFEWTDGKNVFILNLNFETL